MCAPVCAHEKKLRKDATGRMNTAQTVLTRLSRGSSLVHTQQQFFFSFTAYCGVFPKDFTMTLSFNILGNAYIFDSTMIVGKHSHQLSLNVDKERKGVATNQVSFTF